MVNTDNKELQIISESNLAKVSGGQAEINYGICPKCGSTDFGPLPPNCMVNEWVVYRCNACGTSWWVEDGVNIHIKG